MRARHLTHERQTKARAALAGLRACQRIETLEDALDRVIRHAAATVFDRKLTMFIAQRRMRTYAAVLRRKRDGVFQQIDPCLTQQEAITEYVVIA